MTPLRKHRDFVLLQAGRLLSAAGTQAVAALSTISPSIRNAPSLAELEELSPAA